MKIAFAFVCALGLVMGCGGKKDKPADPPAGSAESKAQPPKDNKDKPHHAHHMHVAGELAKFQEALGEKWHQPKSDERMKATCDAVPAMETSSGEIAKATTPASADAAKWSGSTKDLGDAVGALKTACGAKDAAAFEPALEKTHKSFHSLLGLSGGHHEGDGSHEHSM